MKKSACLGSNRIPAQIAHLVPRSPARVENNTSYCGVGEFVGCLGYSTWHLLKTHFKDSIHSSCYCYSVSLSVLGKVLQ